MSAGVRQLGEPVQVCDPAHSDQVTHDSVVSRGVSEARLPIMVVHEVQRECDYALVTF